MFDNKKMADIKNKLKQFVHAIHSNKQQCIPFIPSIYQTMVQKEKQ